MYYVKVIGCEYVDNVGGFWEYLGRILGVFIHLKVL